MFLALCQQVVSQASQHFRSSEKQDTCMGCFVRQYICSVIPFTPACPGQHTHRRFRRWVSTVDTFQSGLPIPLFTFCSKLIASVRMMAVGSDCHLLRQSSGRHGWLLSPPLSSWRLRPYKPPLSSRMVVAPWLTLKPHPNWFLVTTISLHYEVLQFAVFLNEKLDLWLCLPAGHLDSAFIRFLARVSHRHTGIGLGTFPTPWFAWVLSAGLLAVLSPLPDPSKTCPVPVCIPLCLSLLRGVGCRDFWRHWSTIWPTPLSVWFALNLMVVLHSVQL